MITQYPDKINFSESAEGSLNGSGDWTAGSAGDAVEISCRYESAGGNAYITVADGKRISFSGIVYMPKDVPKIKEGTKVTITEVREAEDDNIIVQDVLRFHRGQLNARIWV